MRSSLALLGLVAMTACQSAPPAPARADPASDAPEPATSRIASFRQADTYANALLAWRTAEDVNAWIGARFTYDFDRAMRLSETQRARSGQLAIHTPSAFFVAPAGVCIDLARFAVETLRHIAPDLETRYLMIEFAPVTIGGNTLRLHWVAAFVRDGSYYVFADSKRPGHLAGPYDTPAQFIDEYAQYRGGPIVAWHEVESYQRKQRTLRQKTKAPG